MEIAEFLKFFVLNYSEVLDGCRESTKQELPTATVDRFSKKRPDAKKHQSLRKVIVADAPHLYQLVIDPKNSLQSTAIENRIQSKSIDQ